MSTEFNFILSNNSSTSLLSSNSDSSTSLLSSGTQETSLLTSTNADGCVDAFGGKDIFGTCDLSNISESILTSANNSEAAGSVAYNAETIGSVACGAEAAGSVAFCGSDSSSSSSFSSVC